VHVHREKVAYSYTGRNYLFLFLEKYNTSHKNEVTETLALPTVTENTCKALRMIGKAALRAGYTALRAG
jgi:hypothetical protein